jgi:hypothetical protein
MGIEDLKTRYSDLMKEQGFDSATIYLSLSPQLGQPIKKPTISRWIKMLEKLEKG